jgi:hypothetical protein
MIISSPYVIILSADEQHELIGRARGARAAHRDVVRARIILTAAEGVANARIAADSACTSTRSGSGAAGSTSAGWPVWPTCPGRGGPASSAPSRLRR